MTFRETGCDGVWETACDGVWGDNLRWCLGRQLAMVFGEAACGGVWEDSLRWC